VTQAQLQREALITFRIALRGKRPHEIAASYNEVLDDNRRVTRGEREQLALARAFVRAYESNDDDELVIVDAALQKRTFFDLTPQEQQRLLLAMQRHRALDAFQQVIGSLTKNARKIVDAYDASLLDTSNRVTPEQRARVALARDYMAIYQAVQKGIEKDNDVLIRMAYNRTLAERFTDFSSGEQKHIDKAILAEELEEVLMEREYGKAMKLAIGIQETTGKAMSNIVKFKLQKAVLRFIRQNDLTDLTVRIEEHADGNYAIVNWQWPVDELIQNALIVWRLDAWPPRLQNSARLNSGGRHAWVERKDSQHEGQCEFPINRNRHIYVQGYTAILDRWDQEERWRFSDGIEPTSQVETVYAPPTGGKL